MTGARTSAHSGPDRGDRVRMPTPIHTPLAIRVAADVQSHASADPQQADQCNGHRRCEVLRSDVTGELRPRNCRDRHRRPRTVRRPRWPGRLAAGARPVPQRRQPWPLRAPKACWTRPTKPPGMNRAHPSMSMARTNAARTAANRTNQAADSPSADRVVPATKNAAMPNCATASVAAFRTDMKERSAVDDKIART